MRRWLGGKWGGLAAFLIIASLVAGGLGWATRAALRLESEQLDQAARAERSERLRLALWRLDSRMTAILAHEESRPFNHYSAIFAAPVAYDNTGRALPPGIVVEPSPLLDVELPPWMLLHFQTDKASWQSPQVLSATLQKRMICPSDKLPLTNVTPARKKLLAELTGELPPKQLLSHAEQHAAKTTILDRVLLTYQVEWAQNPMKNPVNNEQDLVEYGKRGGRMSKLPSQYGNSTRMQKDVALLNFACNGEQWLDDGKQIDPSGRPTNPSALGTVSSQSGLLTQRVRPSADVVVSMSPMVGLWVPTRAGRSRLMVMRLVRLDERVFCQGIVLDGEKLAALLAEEVQDLFPGACIHPAGDPEPEELPQTMTSLPLCLDTGPGEALEDPGWTPLRAGLSAAWAAALVALLAVGLGGWSLMNLSERRIRFVSAVTHELRTPLTTLQLYLDMLLGGLIRDEKQRTEYLQTLHAETDRLAQLVRNVLDFSRLENHRARLIVGPIRVADLLTQVQSPWNVRCAAAAKELLVENASPAESSVITDAGLIQQVLGNLLDNACKYSREADDRRIWLRARSEPGRIVFEVEDRGPGVAVGERRAIFRAFRRGRKVETSTGGVGLGLALARRWTQLLRGRLGLACPSEGGACFRVELPTPTRTPPAVAEEAIANCKLQIANCKL
jgi:signal transduction histidine kinase